jgi:carbon storage regulator
MLYITRDEFEKVILDDIEVQILKIEGDSVRIGITAPSQVSVYRHEIFRKITAANEEAFASKPLAADALNILKNKL